MKKFKQKIILFTALLTVSVGVAVGLRAWLHPPLKLQAAQLLPEPKSLQGYVLTNGDTAINLGLLKGHWALLFFGYTSCPDVCPLELQKLGQMLKRFDALQQKQKPLVIFVSLDPERDTPDRLKTYVNFFQADMIGVTGRNSELASLANFFGFAYNRSTTMAGKDYLIAAGADMPSGSGQHYLVNHSSRIFIVDMQSRYIGSFAPPHDADILFTDMQQLVDQ